MSIDSNADWMRDNNVLNLSITEACLPGSHNSFSYHCNTKMKPAKEFERFPKILNSFLKSWSETQNLTITQQMEQGIRYFDIRIEKRDDEIYTVHGLFCDKLLDIFNEMINYLSIHNEEVIIIDINHTYEMEESDYINLQQNLVELFGDLLVEQDEKNLHIPMRELVNQGKKVFLFYDIGFHSITLDSRIWSQNFIYSFWPNKTKFEEVKQQILETGLKTLDSLRNNHVTILQIILTPDEKTIAGGFLSFMTKPSSLRHLNELVREKFLQFIYSDEISSTSINVLLFDYVKLNDPFILFCIDRSKILAQLNKSFVGYVLVKQVYFDSFSARIMKGNYNSFPIKQYEYHQNNQRDFQKYPFQYTIQFDQDHMIHQNISNNQYIPQYLQPNQNNNQSNEYSLLSTNVILHSNFIYFIFIFTFSIH